MKKVLVAVLAMAFAATLSVNAAEGKKKALTDEQKAVRKEITDKYDSNKDGKLDKDERAKMTKEDKEKWEKAGLGHKKKADDSASK